MKISKIKVVDLSHMIDEDMPVYPGSDKPKLERLFTVEANGFAEMKMSMFTHTGTHMDAPAHMIAGGKTLDAFGLDKFIGRGLVISAEGGKDGLITLESLISQEDKILMADFVLLKTCWSRYWGEERYFEGFPVLTSEASKWLGERQLKGLGVDAVSVDPIDDEIMRNHKNLLSAGFVIIENLTNLECLPESDFIFQCFPLPVKDGDGSPVRAAGII